jgi:hypothetical protein
VQIEDDELRSFFTDRLKHCLLIAGELDGQTEMFSRRSNL